MYRLNVFKVVVFCSMVLLFGAGRYVYSVEDAENAEGLSTEDAENLEVKQIYDYAKIYDHAKALYELQQYGKALEEFLKIITLYPANDYCDDAQYMIAECLQAQDKFDIAIDNFTKLIKEYPKSPYVEKANKQVELIKIDIQDWEGNYYDIETKIVEYYIHYGNLLGNRAIIVTEYGIVYEEKKFNEAISWFRKAVDEFPNTIRTPFAQYTIGELYKKLERRADYEKSVEEYRKVVDNYPDTIWANRALAAIGNVYNEKLANKKESIQVYQELIDRNKSDPNNYWVSYAKTQIAIMK